MTSPANRMRSDNKNLDYVNGLTISNIKTVANFWFGANFKSASKNYNDYTFDVIVDSKTETWQITKFADYFRVNVYVTEKRA